jgi:hypothetical protein
MPVGDNLPESGDRSFLSLFDLPKPVIEPAVRACRLFNTALDEVFYDVPSLKVALKERDAPMLAQGEKPPSRLVDFDALGDPEGSLLLIDAATAPYVHRYTDVLSFLNSPYRETREVEIATITGVGSSALGSAALAWDVSAALGKPVLAIVPGYGVADVALQALGGWFGFGIYDYLHAKASSRTASQAWLQRPRVSVGTSPHRRRRPRRFMADQFSVTARAHRTCCSHCFNIARSRSGCSWVTAKVHFRSAMPFNPQQRSELPDFAS